RVQLALVRRAVDGAWKARAVDRVAVLLEVRDVAVLGELARPHHVEAEHVERARAALQILEHRLTLLVGLGREELDLHLLVGIQLVPERRDLLVDAAVGARDRPRERGAGVVSVLAVGAAARGERQAECGDAAQGDDGAAGVGRSHSDDSFVSWRGAMPTAVARRRNRARSRSATRRWNAAPSELKLTSR